VEDLRDQGQFVAVEVESLELFGGEPVLDKVPGEVGDFLLVLLVFPAKFRPQPSDRIDGSEQAAQAVVIALRPGSEVCPSHGATPVPVQDRWVSGHRLDLLVNAPEPRQLNDGMADPDRAAAKRVFEAMMTMWWA